MAFWFIDCETLGLSEDAVILSVGLVRVETPASFLELVQSGWYWEIDAKEQVKHGRKIQKSTLDWWSGQGEEAKKVLKQPLAVSLDRFATEMSTAMSKFNKKSDLLWSRGMIDFKWLSHMYVNTFPTASIKFIDPVSYGKQRDVRTALDILCGDPKGPEVDLTGFIPHNALHDVCADAVRMLAVA